jgi:superfamily II DNA or RNA helicase
MAKHLEAKMFSVGSLVRLRGRDWVVLPQSEPQFLVLRPLGGTDAEMTAVFIGESAHGFEPIEQGKFLLPTADDIGNYRSARMLRDAVKLGFRSSAGPFRSFGHLDVDPRPYQLVPLMMALRLDVVRLLIADDVGIGKTIEAGLIARELIDRSEIDRMAVLCPPHLAEQWQAELRDKFHIEAELVLSSTATRLERICHQNESLFMHYPFVVVSTDFIKTERRRAEFLNHCPHFVIVDEAHTVAHSLDRRAGKHQRYDLIRQLAQKTDRHLILVTATPHSGKEDAFRSLLALLRPDFGTLPNDLSGKENRPHLQELAKHFIQRRRADIRAYMDINTPFPERDHAEHTYQLGEPYRKLFDRVLNYARETVHAGGTQYHQRVRWWSALALLRSLASSPAAASATLRNRASVADAETDADINEIGQRTVLDMLVEDTAEMMDIAPGGDYFDEQSQNERRRLLDMARQAEALMNPTDDQKLAGVIKMVKQLLQEGYMPIVFCRFIPTVEYIAKYLRQALKNVEIGAVTGLLPPSERERAVAELVNNHSNRVLVCTDCLSEGINLQTGFDAIVHYDLSWNPTRHEQREGRIDRYGQRKERVKVITYYGTDNQIDGIVLKVLLRKHVAIRKSLGVSVPVPAQSADVMEAILEGLLLHDDQSLFQPTLPGFDALIKPRQEKLDLDWDTAADREKLSRTLFAQQNIKPHDVMQELTTMQAAIGAGVDVKNFAQMVITGYHGGFAPHHGGFAIDLTPLPLALRDLIHPHDLKFVAKFDLPIQKNEILLTRTHPIIEALATYVLETALDGESESLARRCGVIRTDAVQKRTTALVLRLRYHLITRIGKQEEKQLLAEECLIVGFEGAPENAVWLDDADTLLDSEPTENIATDQASAFIQRVLEGYEALAPHLAKIAKNRAHDLHLAHRRVRTTTSITTSVQAQLPVDIIGIYVYLPNKKGGA